LELADGKALASGAYQQPHDLQSSGVAEFSETVRDSFDIHPAYMARSASGFNHKTGFVARRLPLAVSLPTMVVGFTWYGRDRSFVVHGKNGQFMLAMTAGSIVGSFNGGRLLGVVSA